ncbi:tripartite tricarboxylate transporter substrate binding protein [Salibacterium salarium]|uniref:Tripartite tricarboxylate transporter substrate binding protein n=1 Tax=Salibacterium salarium TaxID=284579 RepID=A0A3R9P9U5_9BACI|nr:tripartite tricarboxylate transporter substrate binding protein [Salibacterium salarium]RSL33605.1 tripartite tricarboxylate transporter substrate binding protein [Salibacterium salarium]
MKTKNLNSMKRSLWILGLFVFLSLILIGCNSDTENNASSGEGTEDVEETENENTEGSNEKPKEEQVEFPTRPIDLIVPWASGGSSDLTARGLSEILSDKLDHSVNVTNQEGANGTVATTDFATGAASDGHEVLLDASGVMTAQPHLRDVQYEPSDFRGVVGLTEEPVVMAVNAESDWETLDDLIEEKDSDKEINFGHSGAGGFPHVTQEAFFNQAGIDAESVPHKGGGPAVTALLGGHIDTVAAHPAELLPHVESGDLRLLGVFSKERFDVIEDVPTFEEKGFDINMSVWKFLLVHKDTSDVILEELRNIFGDAVESSEYSDFLDENNLEAIDIEPEEIVPRLEEELESTGEILNEINLEE